MFNTNRDFLPIQGNKKKRYSYNYRGYLLLSNNDFLKYGVLLTPDSVALAARGCRPGDKVYYLACIF